MAGLLLVVGGRSGEVALPLCPVSKTTLSPWMGFAGAVAVPPPVIKVGNTETDLGKYKLTPISYKCMRRDVGTIVARSSLS